MLNADLFITCSAPKISSFVLYSVVFDCTFGLALRADHMVGSVCVISHALQVFFDDGRWHERNVDSRAHHTFKAVVGIVPVKGVEL